MHEKTVTPEMCLAAVKQNGFALHSVPKMLLTGAIIREAVTQNRNALRYVPDEWRDEAKAMIAADRKDEQ